MATMPFSATRGLAAYRSFPTSLWRTLQTWSEELNRAVDAAHRYEQLRIGRDNNALSQDRASKARQLFTELYCGKR
jgi:hypothetical protein